MKRLPPFLLFLVLLIFPISAGHEYVAESAADFIHENLTYRYIGALAGTLILDATEPISSLLLTGQNISSSGVQFYCEYDGQTYDYELDGSLYIQYHRTNGTITGLNLNSLNSLVFSSLDATKPISFYILVNRRQYSQFLRSFYRSADQLVAVGVDTQLSCVSASGEVATVLSNQGETTLPIPLWGGGTSGPIGNNTISLGNQGLEHWSSYYWMYNIAQEPDYSIEIADRNVYIHNIEQACYNSVDLTNLSLVVNNFNDTYLGQTRVMVRFYQMGHHSFRMQHLNDPRFHLPFSLYMDGEEIPYNHPFCPWQAPLSQRNEAALKMRVQKDHVEKALQGDYHATIVIEIISGI